MLIFTGCLSESVTHTVSVFVLVLGALLVAVLAFGLAAEAFLGAAAFLTFDAAVLGLTVFALVAFGFSSFFSFYTRVSMAAIRSEWFRLTLGAAAFFSAGLASFFASLTGPEGPEITCQHAGSSMRMSAGVNTLWLLEVTLLDTRLQSLVEQRVELGFGCDGDIVVCLDILLDGLSAIEVSTNKSCDKRPRAADDEGRGITDLLPFRSLSCL